MQLASKKYRDKYGLYLIEGDNLIAEAMKLETGIEAVFIRDDYDKMIGPKSPEPFVLSKKLFDGIALTETSQGIVAIVRKREFSEEEFFETCGKGNVVVLDRLQDPGNIGTVIRTAEAAGYKGVIAMKGTGDIYSPKTVRAAAGAIFRMPVLLIDDPGRALKTLKEAGKKTVSACMEAEVCCYDANLTGSVALLIGSEGAGLCGEFIEGADLAVRIPMDASADSLNASVAAGILMYESRRKDERCTTR